MLYFPSRYPLDAVRGRAEDVGLEPWTPGGTFAGWRRATPGARGTLLVFHGNAGSAADRILIAEAFARASPSLPLDVVLCEYPGYGPRPGDPGEGAILDAARAALAAARGASPGPVFVLGESLGSAVAARLAAAAPQDVAGLVLVTPLASVPAVARRHFPWLPGFLARDTWRTDRALPSYPGPVAFVVAEEDEVTFADLGRALFEAYPGRKRLWLEPGATHNGLDWRASHPTWREVMAFVTER
ncbi:MAG: alpha/beta hydrolase [Anaeromyxobacteraceae bacterium]